MTEDQEWALEKIRDHLTSINEAISSTRDGQLLAQLAIAKSGALQALATLVAGQQEIPPIDEGDAGPDKPLRTGIHSAFGRG